MAQRTVPVNVTPEAKAKLQKALRENFLPGSAEWAFATELLTKALELWERGELDAGKSRSGSGSRPSARNRSQRPPRAPLSAPEPLPVGVGANGHSDHGEAHEG